MWVFIEQRNQAALKGVIKHRAANTISISCAIRTLISQATLLLLPLYLYWTLYRCPESWMNTFIPLVHPIHDVSPSTHSDSYSISIIRLKGTYVE